jgi:ATP-dependent Lon protease
MPAMSALSLCLASTVDVYALDKVSHALEHADEGASAQLLRRTYQRMLDAGPTRFVSKPSSAAVLANVAAQSPNFSAVLDDLAKYVELALFGSGTLNFMPVLLAGDPGVGKTHFAKMLAQALDIPYHFLSMGTVTAGWTLSGAASGWSGARHGKIAQALIEDKFANPLFLLDELDKTGGDSRYDPYGALLQLMERETASHFTDEFLDLQLNTSAILWVATCNDLSRIPDYILSRMAVYEVPAPTRDQAAVIAGNIYAALKAENGWAFAPDLDGAVLELLSEVPPREMKRRLLDAMGAARVARRDYLTPQDVRAAHAKPKPRPIGFVPHA